MCHIVKMREGRYFLHQPAKLLVGRKELCWNEGFLSVYRAAIPYDMGKPESASFVAVLSAPLVTQEVTFELSTKFAWSSVSTYLEAGCHIYSFGRGMNRFRVWVPERPTLPVPTPPGAWRLVIPVAFRPSDVVFFDGEDVSVRRFFILDAEAVERLLEREKRLEGGKVFIERYTRLMKEVKRCVTGGQKHM